ncbi:hypothetical protein INT45_003078 [Circinella minor]|uniref:Uncharacterized protein n=1 Tax=Circinella minor TaxID=1195481 RepID=A0A8H7RUQ2_9FUNG|nr:hypothetical protein INT45_003078 [Circinella minor]
MSFLYPLFDRLFRDEITDGGGCSHYASKEMNNRKLDDEERRSKGSSTDGTISHLVSGLEITIIEANGSLLTPPLEIDNHTHFEDRRKSAINLKKNITQNHANANKAVLPKIVLVGLQFYKHRAHKRSSGHNWITVVYQD